MINSRKSNLGGSFTLRSRAEASPDGTFFFFFSVHVCVCIWQQRKILGKVILHGDPHIYLSLSLGHFVFKPPIKKRYIVAGKHLIFRFSLVKMKCHMCDETAADS